MHPFVVLIHLAGAVMLLLWAVRMVRTGVERAYGTRLKAVLRRTRGDAVGAVLSGTVLAVLLQSSTAVGVLAAGFAASGILAVPTGIAALIGADLGSALVVRILSVDLSGLIPVLLLAGAGLFLKFERRAVRQVGRIVLGIAFILLSLQMIAETTAPLQHSAALPAVVGYLQGDPLTAFALAAVLAWALHSSVATVLLLAAFAGHGMLPAEAALPMVLGANLGGGLVAVWLTRGMEPCARRIPQANLLLRGVGALSVLALVLLVPLPVERLGQDVAHQLVNFHLLFNLALVCVALPLIGPVERLARLLLPDAPQAVADRAETLPASALDRSTLGAPPLALASAMRELLRMGETVEIMFRPVMDLIEGGDAAQIRRVRDLDAQVNRLHTDIKLFLAEVRRGPLSEDENRRATDLTQFAISLEHIGDLIAKTLLVLAEKKAAQGVSFSDEGWAELCALHARVQANMQLALNVLVSGDVASARALAREKEELRRLERDTYTRHMARLRQGAERSIATSNLHLETARALKEINSALVTIGYPILAESGQLLKSRLAQVAE
ncbi:Na/Pi cotransporter family protein [Rhodovulum euryhalinum]|uniref:Phosphate:Na+ symporter n=1 Tax=Rhodovulum euryhalinum TaxID=35805 RepID=A0A4R2L4L8_9RHOB|nr:Na/Pi cotransporter family protein [Rhodovulum euryhalinum]TCO74075.1 phosphate:Na+ symporter [Rhodovulum euryhalinum]